MVQGEPEADPAAQRLPLDTGLLEPERVQQIDDLRGPGGQALAVRRLGGVAMPQEIDGQRPVLLPQPHDVTAVGLGVAADAVQQDERLALAGLDGARPEPAAIVADLAAEQIDPYRAHAVSP